MIKYWDYDDGKPHHYINLSGENAEGESRKPGWHCHLTGIMVQKEIEDWFVEYCDGDWEITFRFNSGAPYLDVRITDKIDAMAFLLRWSGNE
jgi:hypothetical protein